MYDTSAAIDVCALEIAHAFQAGRPISTLIANLQDAGDCVVFGSGDPEVVLGFYGCLPGDILAAER